MIIRRMSCFVLGAKLFNMETVPVTLPRLSGSSAFILGSEAMFTPELDDHTSYLFHIRYMY